MSKILRKRIFLAQLFIVLFTLFFLIINLFWKKYSKRNEYKISEVTSKSYSLTGLYEKTPNSVLVLDDICLSIIGTIEIPRINISYPILAGCSDELLKVSVCKFYGPDLNKSGNLCIAGHNYDNNYFFSNLFQLEINDIINIYDTSLRKNVYRVYNIYEIMPTDTSCISQNTNRKKRVDINYM